jgi:hypothetical protein
MYRLMAMVCCLMFGAGLVVAICATGREDRQHQRPPAAGTSLVAPVPVT